MKKIPDMILKIEEIVAGAFLIVISVLVFASAVARTIGFPINWAQDISLLAFAWLTFLGADVVAKTGNLIHIDMVIGRFPKWFQKASAIVFDIVMLIFLLVLIVYGFLLVSQSWSRVFNTLKLSYAWCTLAVPIGSLLLFFTMAERLISHLKKPIRNWGNR